MPTNLRGKVMKKSLFKMVCLLFWGQSALAIDFPPIKGCHDPKPDKIAWIIAVESDHSNFGYCYAGEPHEYIGFLCDVDGEVATIGNQVLGYTDFECIDIGHSPGYHFLWALTHVAVKILQ
jgi:hypothetical protein